MMIAGGCSGPVEPGFRVSHETWHAAIPGSPGSRFWQITNMLDEPLTINRVTYNGEWEAKLADDTGGNPSEGGLPITLAIGESCNFFEYDWFVAREQTPPEALSKATGPTPTRDIYGKEVIYIDIETNRGTFRYRPSEWRFERVR